MPLDPKQTVAQALAQQKGSMDTWLSIYKGYTPAQLRGMGFTEYAIQRIHPQGAPK